MENKQILEQSLRDAARIGDVDAVRNLISHGVNVNTRDSLFGWTPLHLACQRGSVDVVALLLKHHADKNIRSNCGETPASMCSNLSILELLNSGNQQNINGSMPEPKPEQSMPEPRKNELPPTNIDLVHHVGLNHAHYELKNNNHLQDELIVKLRVASAPDPDFVEVELPMNNLTYQVLIRICCDEFGLSPHQILKLRKLPNTKLRKDKDIKRLQNFQEIEIITDPVNVYNLVQPPDNVLIVPANGYQSISKKDQTILY